MEEQILQIIKDEDNKNPLTDGEIASRLQVFREDIATMCREHHIPDSRKRREPAIFGNMKRTLTESPDLSDRGSIRILEDASHRIRKYAAGKLREELLESWTPSIACREKENTSPVPVYVEHAEYARHTRSGAEDDRANALGASVGFDGGVKT